MDGDESDDALLDLLTDLRALPGETPWVEFKRNNAEPKMIGERVSALANAAAIAERPFGHFVWGVEDGTHAVVGTTFRPNEAKVGNEDLPAWLARQLSPAPVLSFRELNVGGKAVVMLAVPRAAYQPVQFEGAEYVRVGSYTKPLGRHPELARELWRRFDAVAFEGLIAEERVGPQGVLDRLDHTAVFRLLNVPVPDTQEGVLDRLAEEDMIRRAAGRWDVTNLGAVLFARDLRSFPRLARKALRVIYYAGPGKIVTRAERTEHRGYAAGFEDVIADIVRTTGHEEIGPVFRRTVMPYPEPALREIIPNALIHQDFAVTGAGPTVEFFDGRMEVTNPGPPLVDPPRFLNGTPKSRNETLAGFMRRIDLCEERGTGVDKIVYQTEKNRLPPPLFEAPTGSTRATLFAAKAFEDLSRRERVRATYLHACLMYEVKSDLTNASLRSGSGSATTPARKSPV